MRQTSSWFLPLIVLFILCLDQASKSIITFYLREFQSVPVISDLFHLTLVHNTGIAFGLFHGGSPLLLAAIGIGILILFFLAYKLRHESVIFRLALGFVLGGAIGNLIDRVRERAVIDFLDFRVWPVFNLADSFITAGVFILILTIMTRKKA